MKIGWRGVVGILLSAGFLYFAFRGIRFDEVATQMRSTNVWLMALAAILATGVFPLRAIRWRPILDPVAPNLPYGKLWRATAIGMMINNVVPARVGELARAFALSRSAPEVPFTASLASLVVDRLFDAILIFGLMFAAMLSPALPAGSADQRPAGGELRDPRRDADADRCSRRCTSSSCFRIASSRSGTP